MKGSGTCNNRQAFKLDDTDNTGIKPLKAFEKYRIEKKSKADRDYYQEVMNDISITNKKYKEDKND